ncbi:hypothetical protein L3Q82_002002 [Scortum barcoo]|uniref:Uncharacterized protein n=1 Tax=Scortum barcoo TaxID=214431 RepID=A0ACB8W0Y8_9TELE|nr:hypothetical protein L3Q82_002002 [Scortum barcoo]
MRHLSVRMQQSVAVLVCLVIRCILLYTEAYTAQNQVEATDESSAAVCSIWHVNVDTLPEWILTSVHQAQWTVGKLNCQNCAARLGGFNFINRSECPCGRDATVHLNKSRVDRDHKHYILIVQPRRTRPGRGHGGLSTDGFQDKEQRPELDSLQRSRAVVTSHGGPAEASSSLADSENAQSSSFSPLYCISQRRRCSLEDDAAIGSSCFCPADKSRTGTDESTRSPVTYHARQQLDTDGEGLVNAVACHSFDSGRTRSSLDQRLLQTAEDAESSPETTAVHEEVSDSALFLRGRSISDSVAEQDEAVLPQAYTAFPSLVRLSKREKNHLKSLRRKQRRRERWLQSQLERAKHVSGSPLDSEEEESGGQRGPHLRCVSRPLLQPTQLSALRSRVLRAVSAHDRQEPADKHAVPSLPHPHLTHQPPQSCRKRFRAFWGYQRQAAMAGRRWHFTHGGVMLDALNLTDMRGWLFDIGLVIVYMHSVNWILVFLFLCFLILFLVPLKHSNQSFSNKHCPDHIHDKLLDQGDVMPSKTPPSLRPAGPLTPPPP